VYSVEEALSKLQIRPLLEALRQAVSAQNLEAFAETSRELKTPLSDGSGEAPDTAEDESEAAEISAVPEVQVRLRDFVEMSQRFRDRVIELSEVEGNGEALKSPEIEAEYNELEEDLFAALATAALQLPVEVSAFPEALQMAATEVLPGRDAEVSPAQVWAPVLAWLAFQTLAPRFSAFRVFERLNLRWALAETFSSVGLEGEAAWKAAAQVRVLLKSAEGDGAGEELWTAEFWSDPDMRWLAGVNAAQGVEYVNKERFEALLCWVQLPALLEIAAEGSPGLEAVGEITAGAEELAERLQRSGFEFAAFLNSFQAEEESPVAVAADAGERL
jgi:hypothetical protein